MRHLPYILGVFLNLFASIESDECNIVSEWHYLYIKATAYCDAINKTSSFEMKELAELNQHKEAIFNIIQRRFFKFLC